MGKPKLPTLRHRDVISILEHNGFAFLRQHSTSHARYRGVIGGKTVLCDVDQKEDWAPRSNTSFFFMVRSQLGLTFAQFYAGHPDIARRAQLPYKAFGDTNDG